MNRTPAKLKVLLVDDHTLFRKGTRLILKDFSDIEDINEAESGKEALQKLKEDKFDIMLLDLEMPLMDGKETAKRVIRSFPDLKIIMLSSHDSLEIISEMIEIGIHSYLVKDAKPNELNHAIMSVINNDFYYNQLVSKALRKKIEVDGLNDNGSAKVQGLSPREAEILKLICQELTMREISEKLILSEQTIHTHRKNLMKKTNSKNAVGLVKYAFQNGIASF